MDEKDFEVVAEALWQLLDDIDTQDDACRENDAAFRKRVRKIADKRHTYGKSFDGQTITWAVCWNESLT